MKPSIMLMLLALSSLAHARGGSASGVGNGGDPIGIRFALAAKETLTDISPYPALFPELSVGNYQDMLAQATILVVDETLLAEKGGVIQECAAKNFPEEKKILINRARWNEIRDEKYRRSLAFHEVLGLMGLETTGRYNLSDRYMEKVPLKPRTQLVCEASGASAALVLFDLSQQTFPIEIIPDGDAPHVQAIAQGARSLGMGEKIHDLLVSQKILISTPPLFLNHGQARQFSAEIDTLENLDIVGSLAYTVGFDGSTKKRVEYQLRCEL